MNKLLDKIKNNLEEASIKFELISLPEDLPMDVASHMKFHNKPLKLAMPNIVLKTEKGFFVIQRRGDSQIDNKKLKKLLGVQRLSLANKEDLEKYGLEPGIVPPLGYDIPTFIDKRVLENQEIYTGTGDRLYALKLNPNDLIKVNKAKVGDFTKAESSQEGGRVLSGIRATGQLHLGNYLGAVKGMLELQENPDYQTFYMVVDLHTLTTPYDKDTLSSSVRNIVIDYLACGLDPQKSTLFIQSMVPEHLELAYLFSTAVSVARMQHLPTFKEKVKQHPENVTMALLNYPVLMAADILVYKASMVPVGIDQEPHLEIAREIARKMNEKYNIDLPEPERFSTSGEYIPSLTGEGKMSKSVEGSYINLNDDLETIRKKIRSVPTSSQVGGEKTGGVQVLFTLLSAFSKDKYEEFDKKYNDGTLKYVDLKDYLAQAIYENLKPIQEKRRKLEQDPKYVDQVIKEGAAKARIVAQKTLQEVRKAMGIDYSAMGSVEVTQSEDEKISIDQFLKTKLKVGTVLEAEAVENSDKLLKLEIDLGEEKPRQILAGIKEFYSPEDFKGNQVVVVSNLEPRVMRGLESQGMMLAADSEEGPVFLTTPKKVPAGSKIR